MPRCATENWGATLAHSIWPCLAMQLMTKGQHLHPQSDNALLCNWWPRGNTCTLNLGHASLCNWWPRGNTGILNLAMPCCASADQGATSAYSIWPCLAVQAMTERWHHTQSGMPRCVTDNRGATLAYSIWPCLAVQEMTEGSTPADSTFHSKWTCILPPSGNMSPKHDFSLSENISPQYRNKLRIWDNSVLFATDYIIIGSEFVANKKHLASLLFFNTQAYQLLN